MVPTYIESKTKTKFIIYISDKKERTVIVKGIKPELNIELLECYFENERSGGGTLETIGEYQQGTHSVVLVYVSKMRKCIVKFKSYQCPSQIGQYEIYTDIYFLQTNIVFLLCL